MNIATKININTTITDYIISYDIKNNSFIVYSFVPYYIKMSEL